MIFCSALKLWLPSLPERYSWFERITNPTSAYAQRKRSVNLCFFAVDVPKLCEHRDGAGRSGDRHGGSIS
jgi:hypothetical protein